MPQPGPGQSTALIPPPHGLGGADNAAVVEARLAEARRLMVRGRVIDARAVIETVMPLEPASALHALGRTYDPYYLGLLPAIDDGSQPQRAAALYREAILHGAPFAGIDLDRLRSASPLPP